MRCQTNLFGLFATHMYPVLLYALNIVEQAEEKKKTHRNIRTNIIIDTIQKKTAEMDRENMVEMKINKTPTVEHNQMQANVFIMSIAKCNERDRTTTKKFVLKICRPTAKVRAKAAYNNTLNNISVCALCNSFSVLDWPCQRDEHTHLLRFCSMAEWFCDIFFFILYIIWIRESGIHIFHVIGTARMLIAYSNSSIFGRDRSSRCT